MAQYVSIIIPLRNEEPYIKCCLQSLAKQDYPKDHYEILLIDGNSTDATLGKISGFKIANKELNIKLLNNPRLSAPAGLNIGIKAARYEIIIRMDAHAFYASDYISSCINVMEETGAANVGGHMRALPPQGGVFAYASMLANDSPFGLGGGKFHDPNYEGYVDTVWLGCYRRTIFDEVGLYDERRPRNHDIDMNARLRNNGYKIYLSSKIKVWYYPRSTFTALWRQRWGDGYEITHFMFDNPSAPSLRHFIPLIFVSTILLLSALSLSGLGAALWGRGAGTKLANLLHGFKGLNQLPGSVTFSNGSNVSNVSNLRVWSWHLLFLRLLALELFAYFSAMLLAVIQAGQSKFTVYNSKLGNKDQQSSIQPATSECSTPKLVLSPAGLPDERTDGPTVNAKQLSSTVNGTTVNGKLSLGSLLLLPLVFVTLHFSYGLGSLWGLISLPYWAAGKQKR